MGQRWSAPSETRATTWAAEQRPLPFVELPRVLQVHVLKFVGGRLPWVSSRCIRAGARDLLMLFRVNKCLYGMQQDLVGECMDRFRQMLVLTTKYHKFSWYDDQCVRRLAQEKPLHACPILVDALSSGCRLPFGRGSLEEYSTETESDIKKIIALVPESINSCAGELRCRSRVTPLVMACVNGSVPAEMVQCLLDHGADPGQKYRLNNNAIVLSQDVAHLEFGHGSTERDRVVLELLPK